jgi:cysteine synthase
MQPYKQAVSPSVIEAIMLPRVIRLSRNLYAASFVIMKLLPASFMLDRARDAKLVRPGSVVIETTSGTFGIALAMLCNLRGYRLILISDPAIDPSLKRRLEDLSARVEIVQQPSCQGGFQRARLDRMAELQGEFPGHFWPAQYDNPHNSGAYARLAELLVETVGQVDSIVGAVGSGGSMCGTASYLRPCFPDLKAVGVDTHGSVLFGQPDTLRMVRGLGNSLMPGNLKHSAFHEVHWVSAAESFAATRALHRRHSLFMGPTSGAAYLVSNWWAEKNPDATVVVLFADEGHRYQDTVYSDEWLHAKGLLLTAVPSEPMLVDHPLYAGPSWSCIKWDCRAYEQVLGSGSHADAADA